MKELKCDYCGKSIMKNEHYKHFTVDDTLKIGTTYFIEITVKYYHYKCYRKMLKETRNKMENESI